MLVEELQALRDAIRPLALDPLRAAIRGQSVPKEFPHELVCKCLVAGIRSHDGFALELRGKSLHQSIERAFNARDVMSNRVPEMDKPEDIPYCFWYPDIPSQDTLRQLLKDHPTSLMRYQVGRACAAGGYVELYKELDLLPDVAIAEEARDNLPASKEIDELVMNAPSLYGVMDDYNLRLCDNPQAGASLNGDTCVRSTLDKRQLLEYSIFPPPFDITEDWCLGTTGKRLEERAIPGDTLRLLYAPLPRHLPAVDKDILILMAAFTGNIDRYARLRRPRAINGEMQCIVRGIYHDTCFARWCYEQPELAVLRKFVHARSIMNDDLTWLNNLKPGSRDDVPRIIWYPRPADLTTYLELLHLIPELKQLVAQALVVSDSPREFVRLEPELTPEIYDGITREGASCSVLFRQFIDERVSYEEEGELAEWGELVHDCHDVAPYDHLVSKEMKPHFSRALKDLTLDNIGFENRKAYPPGIKDARDLMCFMSAFPDHPRDHYQEKQDEIHSRIRGKERENSEAETPHGDV
ncbi:hypothetical protein FBEOM_5374 [Fusarium beomiforme]|uniref:Uncharacterized protein n=1 Tax=Fusarium beomiforme TaxID=44412 RepID=A0A9P5AL27_9HYPO|nr:hypothetical protein FBEOM_5374 [Fusarium beomiforme]